MKNKGKLSILIVTNLIKQKQKKKTLSKILINVLGSLYSIIRIY